jgi:hypothetical protein
MKELVLYYSYTGSTKLFAAEFARAAALDTCEIQSAAPIKKLAAYSIGCLKSARGKGMPIVPPPLNFAEYSAFHVFAPVWAGCIAAPMCSALALLPKTAPLHLHLVSDGGASNQEHIARQQLAPLGLTAASFEDVRSK